MFIQNSPTYCDEILKKLTVKAFKIFENDHNRWPAVVTDRRQIFHSRQRSIQHSFWHISVGIRLWPRLCIWGWFVLNRTLRFPRRSSFPWWQNLLRTFVRTVCACIRGNWWCGKFRVQRLFDWSFRYRSWWWRWHGISIRGQVACQNYHRLSDRTYGRWFQIPGSRAPFWYHVGIFHHIQFSFPQRIYSSGRLCLLWRRRSLQFLLRCFTASQTSSGTTWWCWVFPWRFVHRRRQPIVSFCRSAWWCHWQCPFLWGSWSTWCSCAFCSRISTCRGSILSDIQKQHKSLLHFNSHFQMDLG